MAGLESIARDVRLAVRMLGSKPGFSLNVVASLALGFALVSTTVAIANAYLIRPLPYPAAADRVYHVRYAPIGPWEPGGLSGMDWPSVSDVIEFPLASSNETFYVAGTGSGQMLRGRRITYGILAGLPFQPLAGRTLTADDFRRGAETHALIGERVWRDRFGASADAIGQVIQTETQDGRRETFRIAGVLPASFGGDTRVTPDLVVPLDDAPRRYYLVRLRTGVPPDVAERRLTDAARAVATGLPADWTGVHLQSARERQTAQLRPVLTGITAASALLLIIVFANVSVLVVLRAARRQKEVALRLVLGSTRARLARMLFVETVLLAGSAFAAGLVLSHWCLGVIAPLVETQLGRPAPAGLDSMTIDGSVLLAVGLGGLAGTILLSALPLMLAGRGRLSAVLRRAGSATTDGPGMRRLRSGMLIFEVAATLVLLVTCGLLVRSVLTMTKAELGFEASGLQRARIELRSADYHDAAAYTQFFRRFTERAATSIGGPVVFSSWPPFAEFPERALEVDDRAGHVLSAGAVNVGPGYLATLGIRLRNGRDITWDDVSASAPVAVISESVARLWPGDTAIGKRIRQVEITAAGARPPGPWRTVVGVAADVRQAYGDDNVHDVYTPWLPDARFGSFYLRADRTGPSLTSALAAAAAEIDPHAVVDLVRPVDSENRELSGASFLAILLGAFAGVAGVVAAIGIYGVTAYSVQQREREVAIRVALGADRSAVTWQFVRESGVVVSAGLLLGIGGGILAARALRNQIFGVTAFDPGTLLAMSSLLAAACFLATWVPSRRASARDPAAALKEV